MAPPLRLTGELQEICLAEWLFSALTGAMLFVALCSVSLSRWFTGCISTPKILETAAIPQSILTVNGNERNGAKDTAVDSNTQIHGSHVSMTASDRSTSDNCAMVLSDGSVYSGEMKNGKMHGRGVYIWKDGDKYEGEWESGLQHGIGTFIGSEGGAYFGTWKNGKMDGKGVFRPLKVAEDIVYLREYKDGALVKQEILRVAERDIKKRKDKQIDKKIAKSTGELHRYQSPRPGERIYKNHPSWELVKELQLGLMFSMAQGWVEGEELKDEDFKEEISQWFPMTNSMPPFKWKSYAPRVFHCLREIFDIDNTDYLLSLTGDAALRELPTPGRSGSVFYLSEDDRFLVKTVKREEMRLLLSMVPKYYDHVSSQENSLLSRFLGVHRVSPWGTRNIRFIVMGNVLPSDIRLHRKFDIKGSRYGRTVGKERKEKDPYVTLQDNDVDLKLILSPDIRSRLMDQIRKDCALLEELGALDYSLLLGVHFFKWGSGHCMFPSGEARSNRGEIGGQCSGGSIPPLERQGSVASSEHDMSPGNKMRSNSLRDSRQLAVVLQNGGPDLAPAAKVMDSANVARNLAQLSAADAQPSQLVGPSPIANSNRVHLAHKPSGLFSTSHEPELASDHPSTPRVMPVLSSKFSTLQSQHSIGGEFGRALPATAVPATHPSGPGEPVLLFMGIIDFLQSYTLRKKAERAWKATIHDKSAVSVANPIYYSQRFQKALNDLFIE